MTSIDLVKDIALPPPSPGIHQQIKTIAELHGAKDTSFASISSRIDALSDEEFSLRISNNRLDFIVRRLQSDLKQVSHELKLIEYWNEKLETEFANAEPPESIEHRREVLVRKAKEMYKELEKIMAETPQPTITITQLLKQQAKNKKLEETLRDKRAKLQAFQGLPPNVELAKNELLIAQQEQEKLFQLRERLLRCMADSVA